LERTYVAMLVGSLAHAFIDIHKQYRVNSRNEMYQLNNWFLWVHINEIKIIWSIITTDTSTHMSNLENPAHHHGREGSLQKGAMFSTNAECKSPLQAALAEKDNQMDAVLPQQSCFP
jgi:hypothetical protein